MINQLVLLLDNNGLVVLEPRELMIKPVVPISCRDLFQLEMLKRISMNWLISNTHQIITK